MDGKVRFVNFSIVAWNSREGIMSARYRYDGNPWW